VDKPVGTLRFDDGSSVEATANHPFYSVAMAAFVPAGQLGPGDRVLRLDRGMLREARLASVTAFERVTDVYDLSVSPHHDFFAAGVLVHNY
jgi:intein/homing endonuclease